MRSMILFLMLTISLFANNILAENRIEFAQKMILSQKDTKTMYKLNKINTFVNGAKYILDKEAFGVKNHWASMDQFIGQNGGDCEDFAIAKYTMLVNSGIPKSKLYFLHVKLGKKKVGHMVLGYIKDGKTLILDNNSRRITELSKRKDLKEEYRFNLEQVYKKHITDREKRLYVFIKSVKKNETVFRT